MDPYEFVVSVDQPDDANQAEVGEHLRQSGWDVVDPSDSLDDSRLLFHKRFDSVDQGQTELGQIDDGGAATQATWYRPDHLDAVLTRGTSYSRFPRGMVVTNLAGTTDGATDIGQVLRDVSRAAGLPPNAGDSRPPAAPPPGGPPSGGGESGSAVDKAVPTDAQAKITEMYWGALDPAGRKKIAEKYFETEFERDGVRSESAAWQAASDWVLLNSVDKAKLPEQSRLANEMLQTRYGLLTKNGQQEMEKIRVDAAKAGLATADSLRAGIDEWRLLAKAAPWFMGVALVISVAILFGTFLLVKWGHLNGYGFSLAIFVSALFVVSPATLLLLERPLRGIDNASLTGRQPDGAGDKSDKSDAGTTSPKSAKPEN